MKKMKTCQDCKRFLGFTEEHTHDQFGKPLDWLVHNCDQRDTPYHNIYKLFTDINNERLVYVACDLFIQKEENGSLF